ncbi:MAG TPA: hypothetical protein VFM32_09525, partial [Spongiibacteraceae bacterium]|nr:hypothetical protein [Spongiibacteraceae bacterium]
PLFNSAKHEVGRASGIQAAHFHRHLAHICHREETYVTTERAAIAFILGCRLVFDFLYADNSPLPALHHHYRFLIEHFNDATIASLHTLQHGAAKTDYLAALLDGCSQLSDENLLKLFQ